MIPHLTRREIAVSAMRAETMTGKYEPSNGTDLMFFVEDNCDRCAILNICKILSHAYAYGSAKQWIYDENGIPTCTSFSEKKPRGKGHRPCKKTMELFTQ